MFFVLFIEITLYKLWCNTIYLMQGEPAAGGRPAWFALDSPLTL